MKQCESTNSIGFLKISTSAVSGPIVKLKTFSWLKFGKKKPTPLTSRCQGRNPKVCQVNHCYCWWWRKCSSAHNNRQFLPLFAKFLYILAGSMIFLPSGCGYSHNCHNAQWLNIYEPFQPTSKQITEKFEQNPKTGMQNFQHLPLARVVPKGFPCWVRMFPVESCRTRKKSGPTSRIDKNQMIPNHGKQKGFVGFRK